MVMRMDHVMDTHLDTQRVLTWVTMMVSQMVIHWVWVMMMGHNLDL